VLASMLIMTGTVKDDVDLEKMTSAELHAPFHSVVGGACTRCGHTLG
jgi:hypothetical protein